MLDDSWFNLIVDKGVVGGAFIYLLWYFVNRNNRILEDISANLARFGSNLEQVSANLAKVSDTLQRIDNRVGILEEKIKHLEGQ